MKANTRRDQLEQRSREFASQNPHVGPLFDKYTLERIARGYRHGGAKAIWERLRWDSPVGADGTAQWKLPNSYCTWFARKFARLYPQHAKFFRFRRLTSADRPPRERREVGPHDLSGAAE